MKRERIPGTRLTPVRFLGMNKGGKPVYLNECDCGEEYAGRVDNVMSGNTRSCGCLRRETTAAKWK